MCFTRKINVLLLAAVFALTGCDSESTPVGPDPDPDPDPETAIVDGQVESTHPTASRNASTSGPASVAAEASTVAVAAVQSDGSLDILAEAEVQADGRFSVEDVPSDQSGLVVSARGENGDEVGRVLVHGETRAGSTTTTAPINGETTLEGMVYGHLAAAGVSSEIRNTAKIALLIRMDESSASEVVGSVQTVQAVAEAYANGAASLDQSFQAMGETSADARLDTLLEAAKDHAWNRDQGESQEGAQKLFIDAAVEAFQEGGAELEVVALATAAAATGLDRAMGEAHGNARLDIAKNAVELNLRARSELAQALPESEERTVSVSALTEARTQIRVAASLDEVINALIELEEEVEETLLDAIMDRLPEEVPDAVRAQLRIQLETAFASADLSAHLNSASESEAIVAAVEEYRQDLRDAVEAFISELPGEVDLTAEVALTLLLAAQGGPNFNHGG
jgi:hypothetical protein